MTDDELIRELRHRFEENRKALFDLNVVNQKLVEMNARLERSEALKSDFLSNIRNEIINPLGAIMGLSQQIAGSAAQDDVAGTASMIYSEALKLDFQMRNIFIAAELEAGECDPNIAHVDVVSVIRNGIDSFVHLAFAKKIALNFRSDVVGDETVFFSTDAEKTEVIVANLLANAIEFSPEGGSIEVSVSLREQELLLAVADSGIGIDVADRGVIFERFRQLETGSRKSHPGHGLGLSITRALVELLGGSIDVSGEKGQGALFTVTLPQAAISDEMEMFAEDGNLFLFSDMEQA